MTSASGNTRPPVVDDCYKQIGVYGDGSCPKLKDYVHCRNCPVFAASAHVLLNRELPEGYRADWTRHYSRERSERAAEHSSVVVFRIGQEWMALPTQVLEEVGCSRPIRPLPHRRQGVVLGVSNVRGELVTCISLAQVLGVQITSSLAVHSGKHGSGRMLVLNRAASRFITPVDEVEGVIRYSEADLMPLPATLSKAARTFTVGVLRTERHTLGCLDHELLFHFLERSLT
jgi:chemotaxis-related protein WspD